MGRAAYSLIVFRSCYLIIVLSFFPVCDFCRLDLLLLIVSLLVVLNPLFRSRQKLENTVGVLPWVWKGEFKIDIEWSATDRHTSSMIPCMLAGFRLVERVNTEILLV